MENNIRQNKLSEMTLEELWQLFPIQLSDHNPDWPLWYEEERARLSVVLGDGVAGIDHIGSTCVKGLPAKPIIDILLQLKPRADINIVKNLLIANGWLLMAESPDSSEIDFNKGYTPEGFARKVYHLHVKPIGDWDELYFRDYLASHPETAAEYARLKQSLLIKFEHNRDAYTEAKTEFVNACTAKARAEHSEFSIVSLE